MLVSGTMSDNETTSSFRDRLVELSAAHSAPKLTQIRENDTQWQNTSMLQFDDVILGLITALYTCGKHPGHGLCLLLCALPLLQTCSEWSEQRELKHGVEVKWKHKGYALWFLP